MTKASRTFVQCAYLILITIGISAASCADEPKDDTSKIEGVANSESTDKDENIPLVKSEIAFLNCSLECKSEKENGSLFQCLDDCQKNTRISPQNINKVMSLTVGAGVTEDECTKELGKADFVCPEGASACCCEGFFDCQYMEKIVRGCTVTECGTIGSEREICLCHLPKTLPE